MSFFYEKNFQKKLPPFLSPSWTIYFPSSHNLDIFYQQLCDNEKALKFITFIILPAAEWRKVLLSKLRIAFIHAKYSHSWNSLCSKSCASNDYSLSIVPWNFPEKKSRIQFQKEDICFSNPFSSNKLSLTFTTISIAMQTLFNSLLLTSYIQHHRSIEFKSGRSQDHPENETKPACVFI